jgi:3'-5' exoribonuclease-like protein
MNIMNFLALDTETLSRKPTAAIDQIGLVFFDLKTKLDSLEGALAQRTAFQIEIPEENWRAHPELDIDPNTLKWRSEHAPIATPHKNQAYTIPGAIKETTRLITAKKPDVIYIQGKDFDAPIIKSLCDLFGLPLPWGDAYYKIKCSRDIIQHTFAHNTRVENLTGVKNAHNAVGDAFNQAKAIQAALRRQNNMKRFYAPIAFITNICGHGPKPFFSNSKGHLPND